jgi:hypothetical protein
MAEQQLVSSFNPADAAATFQANMQVVPANTILLQIQSSCGMAVAKEFQDLVFKQEIPRDPTKLVQFFQGRRDLVSMACLKTLQESQVS